MVQLPREQYRVRRWGWWFWGTVLILLVMFYFYYAYPGQQIGPEQPIPFSHRVHAGVKEIPCLFCHPYAVRSEHAGLPVMEKCFFCHDHVIPEHPEIRKEREYLRSGNPVPWKRVFYVPDYVKFRHQPHVHWAKIDCDHCHGSVQEMDRLKEKRFQMGFCIGCHRKMKAQLDCYLGCHH